MPCILASLRHTCLLALFGLIVSSAILAAHTANAQSFRFTWSGAVTVGGFGSQILDISVLINATLRTGTNNHYDVTGFTDGTITHVSGTGINLNGTIDGTPSIKSVFGSMTPRNEFFSSGGTAGVNGYFAPTTSPDIGGFRFSSTTGHEYMVYGGNGPASDNLFLFDNANTPIGNFMTSGGADAFSITQSPAPLAGAGPISYLTMLALGMLWRRTWLASKARLMVVRLKIYCDKLVA